jgi:hypothetical protein
MLKKSEKWGGGRQSRGGYNWGSGGAKMEVVSIYKWEAMGKQ